MTVYTLYRINRQGDFYITKPIQQALKNGRNNAASKVQWRNKVRRMFRTEIQQMLKENFEFYAMTAKSDVSPDTYIRENF